MEHPAHPPGRYAAAMREAVAFTRALGCTHRPGFSPGPPLVTEHFAEIVRQWARLNICSRPDEHIAGMCMQITNAFVEFLQGAGIDAIYTLGWMSYQSHPVYRFGQAEVRRWLDHGMPGNRKVDVHAWVTLPSAEIIDPSWLSTVGIVQGKRDLIGAVIIADADQQTSHQYHPVTVDPLLLLRIGLLRPEVPFAAPRQAEPSAQLAGLAI